MQILPLNPLKQTQNQSISFNANKKVVYTHLKQIPGLTCACCGKKMIQFKDLEKAYKSVSKNLEQLLEKGFFKWFEFRYPEIFTFIKRIAMENPQKNMDQILDNNDYLQELHDIIYKNLNTSNCSPKEKRAMLRYPNELYSKVRRRGRQQMASASVVMKRFESLKKYLDGEKLKTFEQLQIYASKYPRKSISEIINLPEVYEFHKTMKTLQKAEFNEKRRFHFDNIKKLVKKVNPDAAESFDAIRDEAMDLAANTTDVAARMPKIKKFYTDKLKEYGCEKITAKVMTELEQIQQNSITKDTFLAYAKEHKYSDIAIIESLFNPYVESEEHIEAISKDGADNICNTILLCRKCNQGRQSESYSAFLNYHPQMPYHTQQQIDDISAQILRGKMTPKYRRWPIDVSDQLYIESQGKINPNIQNYTKKIKKQSEQKIENNKEEQAQIANQILELQKQLISLKIKSRELKEEMYKEQDFLNNL